VSLRGSNDGCPVHTTAPSSVKEHTATGVWEAQAARLARTVRFPINSYRVLSEKTETEDLKEIYGNTWAELIWPKSDQWRAILNTVTNQRVLSNAKNSLCS